MEMSPKVVLIGTVGLFIVLSFIFGLTGYIKSEQTEDAASTSAQKQDQLTNEIDEFRDIVERVLKIEEQAFRDKEHILNVTMGVSSQLQAVMMVNSKLVENVKTMHDKHLIFPGKLVALRSDTSFTFSAINKDVNSLTQTIDDLHLSFDNSSEELDVVINKTATSTNKTIRNLTEERASDEYKALLNKTITGLKAEIRKTVESVDIASTNLGTAEENLNATKEHFEEHKAVLTDESEKLNISIKSLKSKTDALDSSNSSANASSVEASGSNEVASEELITTTVFAPTTAEFETTTIDGGSGGSETTTPEEGSGTAMDEGSGSGAVTVTTVTTTTRSPEEEMALLTADVTSNRQKIRTLENTVNVFIHETYKKNLDEIAIATGRLHNRHDDAVWMHGLNGYVYRITHLKQTWAAAKITCQNYGGYLAHKGITDFIVRWRLTTIAIADALQPYWIGLSYNSNERDWKWVDNTVAGEKAVWAGGEPNQASFDCGSVVGGIYLYKSFDTLCSQSYFGLCEMKCC